MLSPGVGAAHEYRAFHYSSESGLPTNLLKAVYQDEEGFVWVGTDRGLTLFDGLEFRTFEDALPNPAVKAIRPIEGSSDPLVVTDGGVGFARLDSRGELDYVPLPGAEFGDEFEYAKTAYEDDERNIWIAGRKGILRVRSGSSRYFEFPRGDWSESLLRSFMFAEDEERGLFVATQRGNFYRYSEETEEFVLVPIRNRRISTHIFTALPRSEGRFWLGTTDAVMELTLSEDGRSCSWRERFALPLVSCMVENAEGTVFFGTWRDGLHVLEAGDHGMVQVEALQFSSLNKLHWSERTRTLWVSSDQGLGFVQERIFSTVTLEDAGSNVHVSRSRDGGVYATDLSAVFRLAEAGLDHDVRFERVFEKRELVQAGVMGAFAATGSRLWVGFDGVVYDIDEEEVRPIGLPGENLVHQMEVDSEGRIWAAQALRNQVARITPAGGVRVYDESDGISAPVNVIREMPDGRLLCGLNEGEIPLLEYDPAIDSFKPLGNELPEGLREHSDLIVHDINFLLDRILLGTNRGIVVLDKGDYTLDAAYDELAPENVKALASDGSQYLWIGTDRGLYLSAQGQLVRFGRSEGIPNLSISPRSLVFSQEGDLWVGTAFGLAHTVQAIAKIEVTPSPHFTSVELDGETEIGRSESPPHLPHGSYISARFVALSYPGEHVRYQHRLLGHGDGWSRPGMSPTYDSPRLGAGNYVLQVRAQQDGQMWSRLSEFAFRINPAWYASWWAFFLYFAVAGILATLAFLLRVALQERAKAERALREQEERYELVALGSNDGMWDWDLRTDQVYFSPRWWENLGMAPREGALPVEKGFSYVHEEDRDRLWKEVREHLDGKTPNLQCEVRMHHSKGEYIWVLMRGMAVRDAKGNPVRMAGSTTDITGIKDVEERLRHASLHDALTGLANRVLFMDRLNRAAVRRRRYPERNFAVLYLDLDSFKQINDTLGHAAGDTLLKTIARRLEASMREGDTAARLGGDEFAVLLIEIASPECVRMVAERLLKAIAQPCDLDGHEIVPGGSVGAVVSGMVEDDAESLLRAADVAMYQAKQQPGNTFAMFEPAEAEATETPPAP